MNMKNETPDEKRQRRKQERKERKNLKRIKKGDLIRVPGVNMTLFSQVFDRELKFVEDVMKCLPEVKHPHLLEVEDEILEEHLMNKKPKLDDSKKREKFLEKMRQNKEMPPRAVSHEELRERLHAKLAQMQQTPNEKKRQQKARKKERQAENKTLKKGFINASQPESNQENGDNSSTISGESDLSQSSTLRTPFRKKPVVKSNGEIVYSKFDFISEENRSKSKKKDPKELLKQVEKKEQTITKLESLGKKDEAANEFEQQRWTAALKRAQGKKIRDDPLLLKKSIKKQDKLKQKSQKKWKERTERVEKAKASRQEKRQKNIQARHDERKKKLTKVQKKKGRIA